MNKLAAHFLCLLAFVIAPHAISFLIFSLPIPPVLPAVWLIFIFTIAVPLLQPRLIRLGWARPPLLAQSILLYLPLIILISVGTIYLARERNTVVYIFGLLLLPTMIWAYPELTRLLVKLDVCKPDSPPVPVMAQTPPAVATAADEKRPPPV